MSIREFQSKLNGRDDTGDLFEALRLLNTIEPAVVYGDDGGSQPSGDGWYPWP